MSKRKSAPPYKNCLYQKGHLFITSKYDRKTKTTYFTVVNKRTGAHAHMPSFKAAKIVLLRALQLYVPPRYSTFIKEAIRRVI